jgi:NAD(P)-dependent dehydrogenase (short-subunit alcohol dehydrogenase family)
MAKRTGPVFTSSSTALDIVQHADLTNLWAVVTGGNSGIGLETVRALYEGGANVILCCRDERKGLAAVQRITDDAHSQTKLNPIRVQTLDLSDLDSVMDAAIAIKKITSCVDVLVLNAGVIARELTRTVQGYESGWGVNFVGHYVLTNQLIPLTHESTRIVGVSSVAHWVCKGIEDDVNFEHGRSFSGWQSYGQSKLAMLLFMKYLAKHPDSTGFKGKAFSVHPGAVHTPLQSETTYVKLMFRLFAWATKTPEQGASTTLFACTPLCVEPSGSYLKNCKAQGMAKQGDNAANGEKMVALVEASLKTKFPRYFEGDRMSMLAVGPHRERVPLPMPGSLVASRKSSRQSQLTNDSEGSRVADKLATLDPSHASLSSLHGETEAERKDSIPAVHHVHANSTLDT